MKESTKSIEERLHDIERKIEVIMGMINHINHNMTIKVINEIEDEINEAVDKKINYIKTPIDGGADQQ